MVLSACLVMCSMLGSIGAPVDLSRPLLFEWTRAGINTSVDETARVLVAYFSEDSDSRDHISLYDLRDGRRESGFSVRRCIGQAKAVPMLSQGVVVVSCSTDIGLRVESYDSRSGAHLAEVDLDRSTDVGAVGDRLFVGRSDRGRIDFYVPRRLVRLASVRGVAVKAYGDRLLIIDEGYSVVRFVRVGERFVPRREVFGIGMHPKARVELCPWNKSIVSLLDGRMAVRNVVPDSISGFAVDKNAFAFAFDVIRRRYVVLSDDAPTNSVRQRLRLTLYDKSGRKKSTFAFDETSVYRPSVSWSRAGALVVGDRSVVVTSPAIDRTMRTLSLPDRHTLTATVLSRLDAVELTAVSGTTDLVVPLARSDVPIRTVRIRNG